MMTYIKIPAADLKYTITALLRRADGGFLPGDGFDKMRTDADRLDNILVAAGYEIDHCRTDGAGQYKYVETKCGVRVYRNGYCHKV